MNELKQIVLEEELKERLSWLIRLRWFAAVGVLIAIVSAGYILKIDLPIFYLFLGNMMLLTYNVMFYHYNQRLGFQKNKSEWFRKANHFANIQILLDLIMLTYFIHFSGGLENPFIFYFIFHMVIASMLLSNKAAYFQATIAIVLLGAVLMGEYFRILPHYHLAGFISLNLCLLKSRYLMGVFAVYSTTLYIIIYMTTTIVNRLRNEEKKLAVANGKLEEQDRLKSLYVLTVSRDLQTSISTIQSCLKVVLSDLTGSISDKSREMITRAENRSVHVLHFVKDLLDLSKIRAANELEKKTLSLIEIVEKIIEQLKPKAEERNLHLVLENSTDSSYVSVNPEAWEQVFVNLIVNAIKYTPSGGQIGVHVKEEPDCFQITIWDTGIGIPKEDLPHIFKDFYRAKNAELMECNGTGLGLSIVKQIIKAHRGKIWCDSQVGKGSSFIFTIPKEKKRG